MTSEIKVDTISEQTSANGVTIDGLTIKDGNIIGDVALAGTTPTFTIGDGGAEDAALIFDGNALDYYIALDDSADDLVIGTGSTIGSNAKISLNSDGVLLVGKTNTTANVVGTEIEGTGTIVSTRASNTNVFLNRTGSDGEIINFRKDNTEIGKIGVNSSDFVFTSVASDKDIIFKGDDGGSAITALTLDMSDGGTAIFNNKVGIGTTSPSQLLDIVSSANAPLMEIRSTVTPDGSKFGGGIVLGLSQANDSGSGQPDTQAGDTLGRIIFEGQGTDFTYNGAEISTVVTVGDGNDGRANQATALVFKTIAVGGDSSAETVRFSSSENVFNEGSNDIDFRVEGDSQTHLFFVNAVNSNNPNGTIGMNSVNSDGNFLEINNGKGGVYCANIINSENDASATLNGIRVFFSAQNKDDNSSNYFVGQNTGAVRVIIHSDGDIVNHDGAYNAISDERIKEQIADASSQWDDIKALKMRKFKFKSDIAEKGDSNALWRLGVVAQELEASGMNGLVKPEVNYKEGDQETKDYPYTEDDREQGLIPDGKDVGDIKQAKTADVGDIKQYKEVKYSILHTKALKALQEAQTRIETLETKVTALEG